MFNRNSNPDFYRGVQDFMGYRVPVALVQQMQYEQGVNKGRMDIKGKYFGGDNLARMGPAPQYTSDAVLRDYLGKISKLPMYQGTGYINPWDNARMKAVQAAGANEQASQESFQKMQAATPEGMPKMDWKPNMTYKTESRDVAGNLDQASLQAQNLRTANEKTALEQGRIYEAGFSGRRSMAFDQDIRSSMKVHLDRLQNITPSASNLRFTETVIS